MNPSSAGKVAGNGIVKDGENGLVEPFQHEAFMQEPFLQRQPDSLRESAGSRNLQDSRGGLGMTTESKPKSQRASKPTNLEQAQAVLKEKPEPSWFNCAHGETFETVNARWKQVQMPPEDERWSRLGACWDCQGPMLRATPESGDLASELCTRCRGVSE